MKLRISIIKFCNILLLFLVSKDRLLKHAGITAEDATRMEFAQIQITSRVRTNSALKRHALGWFAAAATLSISACGVREEPTDASDQNTVQAQSDVFLNEASSVSDGLGGGARDVDSDQTTTTTESDVAAGVPAGDDQTTIDNPADDTETGATNPPDNSDPAANSFKLLRTDKINLVEGDPAGGEALVSVERGVNHNRPIQFSVSAPNDTSATSGLSVQFRPAEIEAGVLSSTLNLRLDIAPLPRLAQSITLVVTANDGSNELETDLLINITPVAAPDVYLLAGGTNMVGRSQPGSVEASSGQQDAPDSRIQQLRVEFGSDGVAEDSSISFARDPLHDSTTPIDLPTATVGLGLSFAKAALADTTQNIILVPAALAESAFCGSGITGWQSLPERGNTILFDRAMLRLNRTLSLSGGIFRGILWHQGDADATQACASTYGESLMQLVSDIRTDADPDLRGEAARRPDATIAFVAGTLARGADERGDFSMPDSSREQIDTFLRNAELDIPFSSTALLDDLVPSNGYPCGANNCADLGAAALRETGVRYYSALRAAAGR